MTFSCEQGSSVRRWRLVFDQQFIQLDSFLGDPITPDNVVLAGFAQSGIAQHLARCRVALEVTGIKACHAELADAKTDQGFNSLGAITFALVWHTDPVTDFGLTALAVEQPDGANRFIPVAQGHRKGNADTLTPFISLTRNPALGLTIGVRVGNGPGHFSDAGFTSQLLYAGGIIAAPGPQAQAFSGEDGLFGRRQIGHWLFTAPWFIFLFILCPSIGDILQMSSPSIVSRQKHFEGEQIRVEHDSAVLDCRMRFSVYLPPQADSTHKVPVLFWLTGLTGTDENFSTKAGAQRVAAQLGIALVIPDTSPRGEQVPNDGAYDLGQGASFYVNATQEPWRKHFQMFDYITCELPSFVRAHFPLSERQAISGHSMGGHGALMIAARLPEQYVSVSAFAPIANPINCPWGQKAFAAYLGDDRTAWAQYDSVELLKTRRLQIPMLVDTGTADEFLQRELNTEALIAVAAHLPKATVRYQQGYDHSYYFVSTFIEEHLRFHARHLRA